MRKGLVLAGGSGTRLSPVTISSSKQLLPVYDKPMIYYPISTLMLSEIRDVAIITTPNDLSRYRLLLGDGSQWGMSFTYLVQNHPGGVAEAYVIAGDFLGDCASTLILGDNIFYGHGLPHMLTKASASSRSTIFAYHVNDPSRFGIVEFDSDGTPAVIREKPEHPRSNFAVTGLYFYDQDAHRLAKSLKPSARGELEITDLNRLYLRERKLDVEILGRGFAWLDTGTHDSLLEAGNFIATLQNRQGLQVSCPEEIAFSKNWISAEQLLSIASAHKKTKYGDYLAALANSGAAP